VIELGSEIPQFARRWRNQPEIYKWCRQRTLISQGAHEAWLQRIQSDSSIQMYGIYNDNAAIGVCGLTSLDYANRTAEFSLYIAPEYHRKGYGREALVKLCKVGFEDMGLHRIWGETFEGNPAAKMFESIGFKKEGTLRGSNWKWGRHIDSHVYGLLANEFKLEVGEAYRQPCLRVVGE